jgi:hypothetical protein
MILFQIAVIQGQGQARIERDSEQAGKEYCTILCAESDALEEDQNQQGAACATPLYFN